MFVNCQPARRQCLPDIVPAQAFVRAGDERVWRLWFWWGGLPSTHGLRLWLYCRALPLVYGWQLRFCCGVCPRFTPVFFPLSGKKRRLAVACVSIPPGRDRHSRVLVMLARLSVMTGSLRVWTFFYGDLDGVTGDAGNGGTENGATGPAARRLCAFVQPYWPCNAFRGEYAGAKCGSRTAAAPDCAKESKVEAALRPLWTLFTLRRGCVGAYSQRRHPGTRVDPPGSDLWSGGSCCISMLSTRTIEDLPNSNLWFGKSCGIARQQVEAAPPPGCVREAEWKPHSGREAVWKPALPAGLP